MYNLGDNTEKSPCHIVVERFMIICIAGSEETQILWSYEKWEVGEKWANYNLQQRKGHLEWCQTLYLDILLFFSYCRVTCFRHIAYGVFVQLSPIFCLAKWKRDLDILLLMRWYMYLKFRQWKLYDGWLNHKQMWWINLNLSEWFLIVRYFERSIYEMKQRAMYRCKHFHQNNVRGMEKSQDRYRSELTTPSGCDKIVYILTLIYSLWFSFYIRSYWS